MIHSMAPGQISLMLGLKGPAYAVTSACSSSSHAIGQAFDTIRMGRADIIVTGGADTDVTTSGIGGFNAMRAISTRNDSPETASRPFSKSRDGFVLGEGAACLILEDYEHAKARGAKIYAELVGFGATSDAYHMTAPDPSGDGAIRVMRMALEDAQVKPEEVDFTIWKRAVGWNCTNSMSLMIPLARWTIAIPSPVAMFGFVVVA